MVSRRKDIMRKPVCSVKIKKSSLERMLRFSNGNIALRPCKLLTATIGEKDKRTKNSLASSV